MTALAFGAPAVLWALLLLPVLWWLLRATPPKPQDVAFAPTRLLMRLMKRDETPSRTPWWLMLVRLALAALVIIALAQPILRPETAAPIGNGPLLIAIDDTFAAADDWDQRLDRAERLVNQAEAATRTIVILPTANADAPLNAVDAGAAREALRSLSPNPWRAARGALAPRVAETEFGGAVWLTDGLAGEPDDDTAFFEALAGASATPVRIFAADAGRIIGVSSIEGTADGMNVTLTADADPGGLPRRVSVLDAKGFVLATDDAPFTIGDTTATATLALPTELRNDAVRVSVDGARNTAAVRLLDERFRRRTVGLISGGSADLAQPLLSPLHFLHAALAPSSDLREPAARALPTAVDELIDAGTSVIMLTDVGNLLPATQDALARWINAGGVLVRFAGPRTADGMDDLVPVAMRKGARTLGGTLSWNDPQPLADFNEDGPFAGLPVPTDVTVNRQLLAEPSIAVTERTWASLADGTPFVTGRSVGAGAVVFFHVTADTSWSTLPLSASFVEMLRRVVDLSAAMGPASETGPALPPYRMLDGLGRLVPPGPMVEPLPAGAALIGPKHPPGLYGADGAFRAVNLLADGERLAALQPAAFDGAAVLPFTSEGPTELRGALLSAAALLLLVDAAALLFLMGAFRRRAVAALALAFAATLSVDAHAQTGDPVPTPPAASASAADSDAALRFAMEASLRTRLGYVATGNAAVDRVSEAGLTGLSLELTRRTAVEPGAPMAVNIETDDLAFFPLLYWPIDAAAERPSDTAIAKVDAYMKNGGTILFDTRDQAGAAISNSPTGATQALRRILDGLDIPALEPVPQDHVLTKTFYLLQDFPGRWSGGPLWVEQLAGEAGGDRPARAGDSVSPILITANDFAGAWAMSPDGGFMFPTVPNDPYQREMAMRSGVNIALYTMTGNYKADQVHIPALLERLGQ
ncbi:DUF4159 domain-containing protein [Acuticoccus sp. MNP-M23]|uniref:DUF4159 domain-containing protein n=1 Tax=Acuticoccus sp. MNP-M23 TaxID=3072793 RepID=UPI002814C1E7|nr:DUF4159 domain-containing protein [Acuticoccus sp. MNP-M23]WMS42756.1 DUF4159 domain-containing protein [Acuticoccus sp. MNP-M23]